MRTVLAAIGLVAGCGGPDPAASSFTLSTSGAPPVPSTTPDAGTTTTTTATTTTDPGSSGSPDAEASTSSTGEDGTTDPLRDLGSVDFGDAKPAGCKGKIDFLFMISSSGTMESIQGRMSAALPSFIEIIETKFADFDYHIMVVDGDPYWGHPLCNKECSPEGCPVEGYPCEAVETLPACETTMGAGTVFPAGLDASNEVCAIEGGRRFMTRDQPDLAATFVCAATVGLSGMGGMLGEAMTAAVSPEMIGPGGCNEGFLRDDALLMVTLIANLYDYHSAGKPKLWADALLQAKHGDPNSVTMLSIGDPACPPMDRICDLVKYYFPYWHLADLEAPDYAPAFEIGTDLVLDACSSFIPR